MESDGRSEYLMNPLIFLRAVNPEEVWEYTNSSNWKLNWLMNVHISVICRREDDGYWRRR